jgi:hypothetical protein
MELLKDENDRKKHWERVIAQLREEEERTADRNEQRVFEFCRKLASGGNFTKFIKILDAERSR